MDCVNDDCKARKMQVEETRDFVDIIWRVRRCRKCGWRVTTYEMYHESHQVIPRHIRRNDEEKQNVRRRQLKRKAATARSLLPEAQHNLERSDSAGVPLRH